LIAKPPPHDTKVYHDRIPNWRIYQALHHNAYHEFIPNYRIYIWSQGTSRSTAIIFLCPWFSG